MMIKPEQGADRAVPDLHFICNLSLACFIIFFLTWIGWYVKKMHKDKKV